jgi:hypothetical protein
MQTAKRNDVKPEVYVRDTLVRIAEQHSISRIDELLPWNRNSVPVTLAV